LFYLDKIPTNPPIKFDPNIEIKPTTGDNKKNKNKNKGGKPEKLNS
jgi:hypothetical protein